MNAHGLLPAVVGQADDPVRVPFKKGYTAMGDYRWDEAIVCFDEALRLARGEGEETRFVGLCVKAGMSEVDAKELVEAFEQGKE